MRADLAEIPALKKGVPPGATYHPEEIGNLAKHRHIWPVNWMCDVLDVSWSGLHARLNRPSSTREIRDAKLVTAIETSSKASDRTYG